MKFFIATFMSATSHKGFFALAKLKWPPQYGDVLKQLKGYFSH